MYSDLIPHRDPTPASCRELVRAVDRTVATIEEWGVRIPPQAALYDARRWLDALGGREELKLTVEEFRETSKHSALVVDLYHVSTTLGDDSNPLVASELARIVRGSPADTEEVQNYLAQFWVGTLLAQSKLRPQIDARPDTVGSRPDFLVEWGTQDFLVEVKCPKNPKAARKALSKAAQQLRSKPKPGVIALDLTYSLGLDPFAVTGPRGTLRDALSAAHSSLHDKL